MSTYPQGEVVKVEIAYEDGTVKTLTGEDAKKWGQYVATQSVLAWNRGMECPPFNWVESKR